MQAHRVRFVVVVVSLVVASIAGLAGCDRPPPTPVDPGPLDQRRPDPAPTPVKPGAAPADRPSSEAPGPRADQPPSLADKPPGPQPGPVVPEGPADVAGTTAALVGTWDAEVRLVKGTAHQRLVFRPDGTFDQEDSGGDKGTRTRSGRFFVVGGNPQKFQMELGFDGSKLKSSSSWGIDKEGKLFTAVRQDSPVVYTKTPTGAATTSPTRP